MSGLEQAISLETVDTLKKRYSIFFGVKPKQLRKAWLVEALTEGVSNPDSLKYYLQKLSDLELTFIKESVFNYHGLIDKPRFKGKYGKFPERSRKVSFISYGLELSEQLEPFFYPQLIDRYAPAQIPATLCSSLKQLIDKPEPGILKACSLPEPLPDHQVLFERERLALSELPSLLILLQEKQIKVSDKTGIASLASIKKASKDIHEYYEEESCEEAAGMELIVSYGWLQLLGNCKFSKQSKSTLIPAKKINQSSVDTIKDIWDQWVTNRAHDEFRRINRIKGQSGKGNRFFTNVVNRRQAIITALKECKGKGWVAFEDFSRFMFITGADLEITTESEYLYIYDPSYGEFYDNDWNLLESRYLRCVLAEYAATLGLVDVVMAPPNSDNSYDDVFGDMECLSRYDGLRFFRLTSLGEYVLGLTEHYKTEAVAPAETPLTIHRQGRIVFDNPPTPWERRFISLYADQGKDDVWMLSRKKMMETLQVGGSIDELKTFLLSREDQPFLPEDCEGILKQAAANLDGVKIQGEALIINCKNQEIVDFIVNDKVLAKWCQRLGKLQIVIPKSKENKFRDSLHSVGIGCS